MMHLGTSMYLSGYVLWLIVYEVLPGRPAENMNEVWGAIDQKYREGKVDCQFINLDIQRFCEKGSPI